MRPCRPRRAALGALITVLIASGCSGNGGDTDDPSGPPAGTPGTIALALSGGAGTLTGAGTANATITVTRGGSFTGTVTLSVEGAPAGVTATASPASLPAGTTGSALTITSTAAAAPGTYPLTVRATGTGVTPATATWSLTIQDPPPTPQPDFSLAVSTDTLRIEEGSTGSVTITVTRINDFADELSFVSSEIPLDVSSEFSPLRTTGNSSTFTITAQLGAPAGSYPIVITANTTGTLTRTAAFTLVISPQPTAGTLTLTPEQLDVVQGQPGTVAVAFSRGAGVTGDATLTVENLPSTLTASFSPNPVTGAASTLTVTPALAHPPGVITIRVRVTVGSRSETADLRINTSTFTPADFAITLTPVAISVTAGDATSAAVAITRTGDYAGGVSFAVSGAPAGVTAGVTPSPATGTTATLNVTSTTGAAPGVYPLTVTATGAGITGTRTANLSLTVNAPAGGSGIQWRFCDVSRIPIWFGVRSGTSGSWTQVAQGANTTYAFTMDGPGQVAFVQQSEAGFNLSIFNATAAEALAFGLAECVNSPVTKTVHGTLANVPANQGVQVLMGGAAVYVPPGVTTFTLTGVADRATDLIAMRGVPGSLPGEFASLLEYVVRRNINPAAGATMPVVDFDGSGSMPSASRNLFLENVNGDPFALVTTLSTANGTVGNFLTDFLPSTTSPRSVWGIGPTFLEAGDLHRVMVITTNASAPRQVQRYQNNFFNGNELVFGPTLNAPTISALGSSPVRLRATGTWQAEYGVSAGATFIQSQAAPNARTVTMTGSRDFFGDAGFTFEVPDFTGAPGWNPAWMLRSGVATDHIVSAIGSLSGGSAVPADGVTLRTGQRIGTITP